MTIRSITAVAAIAALASASFAQVNSYTRSSEPSRDSGFETSRGFLPLGDPRNEPILNAAPFPVNRIDDVSRLENGRVWTSRLPIGGRTEVDELTLGGFPGPAGFGAPESELGRVIFVRLSYDNLPVVAISPYQRLDDEIVDILARDFPFVRTPGRRALQFVRTEDRSAEILEELRAAKNLWLDEQGYIKTVRTHVNGRALMQGVDARGVSNGPIEPRAIIRVRPEPQDMPGADRASAEPERRMSPARGPKTRIVVVSNDTDADAG
ncbi:MAG: hypothetical protein AAGD00_11215 [Planctomycetota bacterium]